MGDSDDERDLEDELLACLQSESEEEEETDAPQSHIMTLSKWERFIHLGEDLTARIFMVTTIKIQCFVLDLVCTHMCHLHVFCF
jgi:hypothetical protein